MKKIIIRGEQTVTLEYKDPSIKWPDPNPVLTTVIDGEKLTMEYIDSEFDPKVGDILVNPDLTMRVAILSKLLHIVAISKNESFSEHLGLRTIDSLKEEGFKIEG